MKSNRVINRHRKEQLTETIPHPSLSKEEQARQHQQDKEFIKAMNELTTKAGLLSDDPYFGGV